MQGPVKIPLQDIAKQDSGTLELCLNYGWQLISQEGSFGRFLHSQKGSGISKELQ